MEKAAISGRKPWPKKPVAELTPTGRALSRAFICSRLSIHRAEQEAQFLLLLLHPDFGAPRARPPKGGTVTPVEGLTLTAGQILVLKRIGSDTMIRELDQGANAWRIIASNAFRSQAAFDGSRTAVGA